MCKPGLKSREPCSSGDTWDLTMATLFATGSGDHDAGLGHSLSCPSFQAPSRLRRGCHISIFQSISQPELDVFKNAPEALEESLPQKKVQCGTRLSPGGWKLAQLPVQERPEALQAELNLTLKVLENVTDPGLGPILDQPLLTLNHIHSQLQACTQPQPAAEPRPPSRRLSRWLHRLQEAQEKETPGCLEVSVTSNLFRLLIRDLKCVASGNQCDSVSWPGTAYPRL
ncbi:interferon lambda-2-like [Mesocricetus auratus]|uniref:Interferon lambda-2-like n=1 Tax=Mesocricetus auratus TaxID=10036 RepID=A0ABM2WPR9_MESAU|nr:interferon lambda-2-like [Mesocricetus auratus]